MKDFKQYPIVYVQWHDSCSPDAGWHCGEEEHDWMNNRFMIEDVGFLIKEFKDRIVIAGGRHGEDEYLQTHRELMIPRGCIIKMKRLKRP